MVTAPYYWDQNEDTRAFAKRYLKRFGKMPNMIQASLYDAMTHYPKAVEKAGTDDTAKVAAAMKELPINDFMTKNGVIRADGRVMRDMYVSRVKAPAGLQGRVGPVRAGRNDPRGRGVCARRPEGVPARQALAGGEPGWTRPAGLAICRFAVERCFSKTGPGSSRRTGF